ncbi:MAG: glycosyltransferase family 2 protein [Candidatus Colwellbacteria bacterium]
MKFSNPKVSVIVPCRNEEKSIKSLLEALWGQTYPTQDMEVVIADGMSTDGTRKIISEFKDHYRELDVHIVDNEKLNIPSGINRAITASGGEFIVRIDAHSIPHSNYVEKCVDLLEAGRGSVIGGTWVPTPGSPSWLGKSIVQAISHPLGVGDALHRYSRKAGFVDTVSFGAFHRSLLNKVGLFNEGLLTNEDYEFNARVRASGGKIWFDPKIKFQYIAKSKLRDLAKQYIRYGFWKGVMLKSNPGTIRWRQALPPLFVLSIIVGLMLGLVWGWFYIPLVIMLSIYFSVLLGAGLLTAAKESDLGFLIGLPIAITTMHFCWGGALLWSLISKSKIPTAPAS